MATIIGTTYLNGCNYQIGYDLISQNNTGNSSTVKLYGILNVTNNYISWSRGTASVYNTSTSIGTYYAKGTYTLVSGTYTFNHDSNGNLSMNISGTLSTTFVSGTASGKMTLPHIDRFPIMTEGMDFTDEENPTIKFTSYGTFPIRVKLEAGGNTKLITRDLSDKNAKSYTFELTEEERNKLRELSKNSKTLQVTETVCAMNGETELNVSYVKKIMTVVNAEPTFTYTSKETDEKLINLFGKDDGSTIVQNVSKIAFSILPEAFKMATISNVAVTNGNNTVSDTSSPYEDIVTPTTNTFKIDVIDSRGYVATKNDTRIIINYQPVSINNYSFVRENPTSANLILNASFSYNQVTFGDNVNKPEIKWKVNEEEWISLNDADYTVDTETSTVTVSNLMLEDTLDYRENGTLYVSINDLLSSASDNMQVSKGIPIYDFGEHDFQINGDLFLADENRENKIRLNDTIVEVVENTNGVAIKYANGIMICYSTKTFNNVKISTAWGSMFASSGDARGFSDYPVPFIKLASTNISILSATNDCWLCSLRTNDSLKTPPPWQVIRPSQMTINTLILGYIAIGKWK